MGASLCEYVSGWVCPDMCVSGWVCPETVGVECVGVFVHAYTIYSSFMISSPNCNGSCDHRIGNVESHMLSSDTWHSEIPPFQHWYHAIDCSLQRANWD